MWIAIVLQVIQKILLTLIKGTYHLIRFVVSSLI